MGDIETINDKARAMLNDFNPEILKYQGNNLIEDHILDSFGIIELVVEIESTFEVDIDPELLVEEHFVSVDSIIAFISEII